MVWTNWCEIVGALQHFMNGDRVFPKNSGLGGHGQRRQDHDANRFKRVCDLSLVLTVLSVGGSGLLPAAAQDFLRWQADYASLWAPGVGGGYDHQARPGGAASSAGISPATLRSIVQKHASRRQHGGPPTTCSARLHAMEQQSRLIQRGHAACQAHLSEQRSLRDSTSFRWLASLNSENEARDAGGGMRRSTHRSARGFAGERVDRWRDRGASTRKTDPEGSTIPWLGTKFKVVTGYNSTG